MYILIKLSEKLQILNFQLYRYQNSVNFRTHQSVLDSRGWQRSER